MMPFLMDDDVRQIRQDLKTLEAKVDLILKILAKGHEQAQVLGSQVENVQALLTAHCEEAISLAEPSTRPDAADKDTSPKL